MGKPRLILDKNLLEDLYYKQHLSQKAIASKLGCSIDAVARNMQDYNMTVLSPTERAKMATPICLTDVQLQVLNGALLGDGCLYLHKHNINAQFCYLSKSKQHVEFVGQYFKEYFLGKGIVDSQRFDKRTNKIYTNSRFRTHTNPIFTEQYNRWYPNGIKHIPNDLMLNPLTVLIWYIGDGAICHSNRSEHIKLATHCFNKKEQEHILLPQLSDFDAKLMKADISKDGEQQYFIYIPHKKESDFIEYIGECPFNDYLYKWDVGEYKNSMPKDHRDKEQIFCEMYKSGMTYYKIAKQFDIEPNAVKYYLIKNNIYKI